MKFLREEKGIIYKIFELDELQEMALVIGEAFSTSEPMAVSQGIAGSEMTNLIEQFGEKAASESLSIVARLETNQQIVGVLLANDWGARSTTNISLPSQKFNPILAILDELDTQYKEGKKIEPNKYLHLEFLAVTSQYRGSNIAHNLVSACLENAINRGYEMAVSTVTNPTSHHIHKKFNFKDCFKISYKTFTYEERQVFVSLADSIIFMDRPLM